MYVLSISGYDDSFSAVAVSKLKRPLIEKAEGLCVFRLYWENDFTSARCFGTLSPMFKIEEVDEL